MWDSKLSGKKKLAVDEEVIVDYKTSCAIFNYSFKLDGYYFNVVQIQDGKFELKINSFTFTELKEAEEQGLLNKNDNKAEEENLDEYDDDNDNNINNNNNNYKYNNEKKKYGYNDEGNEDDDDENNDAGKGLIE